MFFFMIGLFFYCFFKNYVKMGEIDINCSIVCGIFVFKECCIFLSIQFIFFLRFYVDLYRCVQLECEEVRCFNCGFYSYVFRDCKRFWNYEVINFVWLNYVFKKIFFFGF